METHGRIFELYAKTCVLIQAMEHGNAIVQQTKTELEDITLSTHFEGWVSLLAKIQSHMNAIKQDSLRVQRDVRIAMSQWSESVLQTDWPVPVASSDRDPLNNFLQQFETFPRDSSGGTE